GVYKNMKLGSSHLGSGCEWEGGKPPTSGKSEPGSWRQPKESKPEAPEPRPGGGLNELLHPGVPGGITTGPEPTRRFPPETVPSSSRAFPRERFYRPAAKVA